MADTIEEKFEPQQMPELMDEVVEFLKDSSEYYSSFTKRKIDDLRMYSGDFWDKDRLADWHRENRRSEHLSQWSVFSNAITSPLSNSPWHIQLEEQKAVPEVQDAIDAIEADTDAKRAYIHAFESAVRLGAGFVVITTVEDEVTSEPKLALETVQDISRIALDPNVETTSARDAEAGAIVNYISEAKAKRLYGKEVLPLNYPKTLPALFDIGEQWKSKPTKTVPIVTYFKKNDDGFVTMYKLCGDLVVEKHELPCTEIPIIRMTAYEVYRDGVTDYEGIVSKTYTLQLGLNLAYSTLLERANRSPKANWMMPVGSMDGLEQYYERAQDDDSLVLLFNATAGTPIQLKEAFETNDLTQVISTVQSLMAAVLGVPTTGIDGIPNTQKTATEILQQQVNSESNVSCIYNSAYEALRAIGNILIEFVNEGSKIKFSLQSGPDVITQNMKRRQELTVMSQFLPDNMKPILAKYYAETLTTDDSDMLSKDIVANLDPSLKLVSNEQLDPYAIHEIKQMKAVADQAMQALEEKNAQIQELQTQLSGVMTELSNRREDRQLEWAKFSVTEKDKVAKDSAELQLKAQQAGMDNSIDLQKLDIENQKVAMEAQDRLDKTIASNDRMIAEEMNDGSI